MAAAPGIPRGGSQGLGAEEPPHLSCSEWTLRVIAALWSKGALGGVPEALVSVATGGGLLGRRGEEGVATGTAWPQPDPPGPSLSVSTGVGGLPLSPAASGLRLGLCLQWVGARLRPSLSQAVCLRTIPRSDAGQVWQLALRGHPRPLLQAPALGTEWPSSRPGGWVAWGRPGQRKARGPHRSRGGGTRGWPSACRALSAGRAPQPGGLWLAGAGPDLQKPINQKNAYLIEI